MAGNVEEWVADWYGEDYYARSLSQNPTGPDSGKYRVTRGGLWVSGPDIVRGTNRGWQSPDATGKNVLGFRCARGPE